MRKNLLLVSILLAMIGITSCSIGELAVPDPNAPDSRKEASEAEAPEETDSDIKKEDEADTPEENDSGDKKEDEADTPEENDSDDKKEDEDDTSEETDSGNKKEDEDDTPKEDDSGNKKEDGADTTKEDDSGNKKENGAETSANAAVCEDEAEKPLIDISDCKDLDEIIDSLDSGLYYATGQLGSSKALFVSEMTFDDLDGHNASLDTDVYFSDSKGKPVFGGHLYTSSTGSPLAAKDGFLYTCTHHSICKYTVEKDRLIVAESAAESFDQNQNTTYYYMEGNDDHSDDQELSEASFNRLFEELFEADVISFSIAP